MNKIKEFAKNHKKEIIVIGGSIVAVGGAIGLTYLTTKATIIALGTDICRCATALEDIPVDQIEDAFTVIKLADGSLATIVGDNCINIVKAACESVAAVK